MKKILKLKLRTVLLRSCRLSACFLCLCLLIAMTGCTNDTASMLDTDLPDKEPMLSNEAVEDEDLPSESNEAGEEAEPKTHDNYAEAYLDILTENSSILTDGQLTDKQINASGIDIGDGKIAILDVFGDEIPELLYIYTDPEVTEFGNCLFLKIFTFSKEEGIKSVFDTLVYSGAGGGSTYCVYLNRSGELIVYYQQGGAYDSGGFWPITPLQYPEPLDNKNAHLFRDGVRDFARLFYTAAESGEEIYFQYGEGISKKQFDIIGKEMMTDIAQVIFQGAESPEYGQRLYKYGLWKGVAPFEENCMTYAEAVAWLEAQI